MKIKTEKVVFRELTLRLFSLAYYNLVTKEKLYKILEDDRFAGTSYKDITKYIKLIINDDEGKLRISQAEKLEQYLIQEIKTKKFQYFINFNKERIEESKIKWLDLPENTPHMGSGYTSTLFPNTTIEDLIAEDKEYCKQQGVEWSDNTNYKGLYTEWEDYHFSFHTYLMYVASSFEVNSPLVADWIISFLKEVMPELDIKSSTSSSSPPTEKLIDMNKLPEPLQLFIECLDYPSLKKQNIPHNGVKDYHQKLAAATLPYSEKYGITHIANSNPKKGISSNHAAALGFIINYES